MIKTLSHVGITVKDLNKSLAFYSNILGLPVIRTKRDSELKVVSVSVQAGNSAIEIFSPIEQEPSGENPVEKGMESVMEKIRGETGLNHISLSVDDMEGTCQELKNKGIQFTVEPRLTGSGSKVAFLSDPDGILIELIQRP